MRLNIAEENSDSQAWEYICILAICIECLQRTTEWIFSCFFWFSNKGFALLHTYKMALITLFFALLSV